MNVTFIIGNGFDLNIGLKTSYKHFIDFYMDPEVNKTNEDNELINSFKELIKQNKGNWSDVELELGKVTSEFSKMLGDCGKKYQECYLDILDVLAEYLECEEERASKVIKDPSFLGAFGRGLQGYLSGQKTTDREDISSITNTIPGGITFNIINFNYTRIIDNIKEDCSNPNTLVLGVRQRINGRENNKWYKNIHVHGDLSGYMIFGVDNEKQIGDLSVFDNNPNFKNIIIKKENDAMIGENLDLEGLRVLNNSDVIYIYGVSLGKTDTIWWERVIEWMKENSKACLIYYSYEMNKMSKKRTPIEREEKKEFERNRILAYSKYDNDINSQIEKRIYIDGNNIFEEIKDLVKE